MFSSCFLWSTVVPIERHPVSGHQCTATVWYNCLVQLSRRTAFRRRGNAQEHLVYGKRTMERHMADLWLWDIFSATLFCFKFTIMFTRKVAKTSIRTFGGPHRLTWKIRNVIKHECITCAPCAVMPGSCVQMLRRCRLRIFTCSSSIRMYQAYVCKIQFI